MDTHKWTINIFLVSGLILAVGGNADKTYFLYTDCKYADPPEMMDKAWVTVVPVNSSLHVTHTGPELELYGQVSICDKCSSLPLMTISLTKNCTFLTDTKFDVMFSVKNVSSGKFIWSETITNMSEHGRYSLYVSRARIAFSWAQTGAADDPFIPIYVGMAILFGVSLLWIILRQIYKRGLFHRLADASRSACRSRDDINSDLGEAHSEAVVENGTETKTEKKEVKKSGSNRLRSLDAFRGMSLVIMMFVNYGGGGYWFFAHSFWNGLTVADLVFPWFTWIMGTSIALSFNGQLKKGVTRKSILLKVIKRTVILFSLGILINCSKGPIELSQIRIPGVLQRLAFSYFCVALLESIFARTDDPYTTRSWAAVRDIVPFWLEWVIALSIVAAHLLLTFLLPIKDCPTGYIGPGGLHENGSYYNCTGGAARVIDEWLFSDSHIYQHPTCKNTYHTTVGYDPEGVLGSLTSVFMCFLGLQAGKIFLIHKNWRSRILRFIMWSILLGLIAGGLCSFSQNGGVIPVNKNLWSISFILALSSMAFFLLAMFYLVIDVYHIWSGTPFFYPGMNSIVVYMCHEVFSDYFPITWVAADTHAVQLALQSWGVTLWVLLATAMYYSRVFIAI